MTTKIPEHDLNRESYIDPKDHKEHVNHGMLEYSEEDLKMHNDAFHAHEENEENLRVLRLMIGTQDMKINT